MTDADSAPLVIATGPSPDGSVIWLHGLGADGHDFEPIVPHLRLPNGPDLRFIFPHAPIRPVTINGGVPMRAWFDIISLSANGRHDEAGFEAALAAVRDLIAAQVAAGIDSRRIVLAGFSQGGAVAMHAALTHQSPLAGLMVLSSFLPFAERLEAQRHPNNSRLPILMCHGRSDPMLPASIGQATRDTLIAMGYAVQWHTYPMGHAVCAEEIGDIRRFLGDCLGD